MEWLSETDAAYIAGLIDADGMVTCSYQNKNKVLPPLPRPLVTVHNGDFGLLLWLRETIQVGSAYEHGPGRPRRPDQNSDNWNPVHRYQLTGGNAQKVLRRVRPYLRVKAKQADLVLTLPLRGVDFPQHASPEQRAAALRTLVEIRRLNARGPREWQRAEAFRVEIEALEAKLGFPPTKLYASQSIAPYGVLRPGAPHI
jgi:hypothetical protein